MYGHKGCAGGLGYAGKIHTVDVAAVPALAEFHGYGQVRCLDHGLYHLCSHAGLLHQGAAFAVACYLGGGAAHVDVYEGQLALVLAADAAGNLCHYVRVPAEKLYAAGTLVGGGFHEVGALATVLQTLGGYHFGEGEIAAVIPADGAVGHVGEPRHGGQHDGKFGFKKGKLHYSKLWLRSIQLRIIRRRQGFFGGILLEQYHVAYVPAALDLPELYIVCGGYPLGKLCLGVCTLHRGAGNGEHLFVYLDGGGAVAGQGQEALHFYFIYEVGDVEAGVGAGVQRRVLSDEVLGKVFRERRYLTPLQNVPRTQLKALRDQNVYVAYVHGGDEGGKAQNYNEGYDQQRPEKIPY